MNLSGRSGHKFVFQICVCGLSKLILFTRVTRLLETLSKGSPRVFVESKHKMSNRTIAIANNNGSEEIFVNDTGATEMFGEVVPSIYNTNNEGETRITITFIFAISCIWTLAALLRQYEPGLN